MVYDTGALLAAERRAPGLWWLHEQTLAAGVRPVVPVVVLAQAWRGGPQHDLSRLLRGCPLRVSSEEEGRAAGLACGRSGLADVVDGLVVIAALELGGPVVTSDPDDLARLVAGLGQELSLHVL